MLVTLSGIATPVRSLQLENADPPMDTTLLPPSVDGTATTPDVHIGMAGPLMFYTIAYSFTIRYVHSMSFTVSLK